MIYAPARKFTVNGNYAFDAEFYPDFPVLNDAFARQSVSLGMQLHVDARTSVSASGQYSSTATASDLLPGTGIEIGRHPARGWGAQGEISRRVSPFATVSLEYAWNRLEFGGASASGSHAVSLGFTRQLGPRTGVSLLAGPRYIEGSVSAGASASIQHRVQHGHLDLSYARGRSAGPLNELDTESLSGAAQYAPSLRLMLALSTTYYRYRSTEVAAQGLGASASAGYMLAPHVQLVMTYQNTRQQGRPDSPDLLGRLPWIPRNVVSVGITVGDDIVRTSPARTGERK
jgi:hypothetical protein